MRRLEDDGRRADSWPQRLNRASSGLSQVEDHVHELTVYISHPAVQDGHDPIIDQVEEMEKAVAEWAGKSMCKELATLIWDHLAATWEGRPIS